MQTPKPRNGTLEVPRKVSPRAVRQLKTTAIETESSSSPNQAFRTPKERSPKVADRRSPRSPVPEKRRPSKISELEIQISQLQEQLKKANDQLSESESWKKQAQLEAEESQKQLLILSSKLEESQKQLPDSSTSEENHVTELQKISPEDQAWESELEAAHEQNSENSDALSSAVNEIQRLKAELERVAESEVAQTKQAESTHLELESLKENLIETRSLVENMKIQLRDSKESEANAKTLANETLMQLEAAKQSVEALRLEGMKGTEAYNFIATELDRSRARVNSLEELVSELKADLAKASMSHTQEALENGQNQKSEEQNLLEAEVTALKSEVEQLRAALENAESRTREEQIQSTMKVEGANELVEKIEHAASQKEGELLAELGKAKSDIEELKANLMEKENELQGIEEENQELHFKLEKNLTSERESELENELQKLNKTVADLKSRMMDKETELQNTSEDNEMLRLEVSKRGIDSVKANDEAVAELDAARARERDALMKLGLAMEEADKNHRRAARVAEQLNAAQTASSEMEAELRRLKVQSDQWRKAAEAAVAMLSLGNNGKFIERTGSLDNPLTAKRNSPFSDDIDDDLLRKKNGNMLKKIGVLWKKPNK